MAQGISAGDLVMIVKPSTCCGNGTALGRVFTVAAVDPRGIRCLHCGQTFSGPNVAHPDGRGYLPSRCKRIPPTSASESTTTELELYAS